MAPTKANRWTIEKIEEMRARKLNGETLQVIGNSEGITKERVRQLIGNLGHWKRYSNDLDALSVVTRLDRNEAARILNIDPHSVDRVKRKIRKEQMTPRKAKAETNPVWQFRAPAESLRQLDELCKRFGMNRMQVVLMLIAKEYGNAEAGKPRPE